jgi:hypothetical protein
MAGNCYESAFMWVYENTGWDWVLVHGSCIGRGPIEGVRFGHAWVEIENLVIDTEKQVTMPKDLYYEAGQITDTHRYTRDEAIAMANKTGHFGCWHETTDAHHIAEDDEA